MKLETPLYSKHLAVSLSFVSDSRFQKQAEAHREMSASGSKSKVRFDLDDDVVSNNDGGSVEMDQGVAQRLFEVGASVVLLDVPGEIPVAYDLVTSI